MGAKKTAPARGGTSSKRSRAAEVHNLSERVSNTIPDLHLQQRRFLFLLWSCVALFLNHKVLTGTYFGLTNRGEEIGSMRRCVHYKNSYQTAIRLTFSFARGIIMCCLKFLIEPWTQI